MRNAPFKVQTAQDPAGVIVAVVVTRDRLDQIKATLDALLQAPVNQIVVVDNGSTDGTRTWLQALSEPRVLVDMPERNLGGAGGFARGIALAVGRFDPDWVLLMDDDARPRAGAIDAFRQMDLSRWDAVASAVYYPSGEICEMNRPSRNPFWSLRTLGRTALSQSRKSFHVADDAYAAGAVTEIDVGSFVGFFISRDAIDRTGLPDARLFIYGDDVLYSLAMRRAGVRIGFAADVAFNHDCGTRSTHDGKRVQPLWKAYYLIRNKIVVYRQVAGPLFWLILPGLLLRWTLRSRNYHEQAPTFRRLMRMALSDGLRGSFDRSHASVVACSRVWPNTNKAPQD